MSRNTAQVTIAATATLSSLAATNGQRLAGIYIPSNWTGTTFELSAVPAGGSAGTGSTLANNSGAISYTCAAGQYIAFDTNAVTAGIENVQILAGSTQSNAVTLTLVFVPFSA